MWKPSGAKYYVERVKKLHEKHAEKKRILARSLKWAQENDKFEMDRTFFDYNQIFTTGLSAFFGSEHATLLSVVSEMSKRKKKPLNIIEDGAGNGAFLREFQKKLASTGSAPRITALTLAETPGLSELKRTGVIKELYTGDAELFVPKQPADLIVSLAGSINYHISQVGKDHLLKYAHSLGKNGLMLISMDLLPHFDPNAAHRTVGLSRNPKSNRKMSIGTELAGIEKAFEKRGFKAKFFWHREIDKTKPPTEPLQAFLWQEKRETIPNLLLIVQRKQILA
ncbi:MAG: hypothetical protein NTY48_00545 [Candidatus Diapherotrites archaeon]|nr:hypothetical protein [Candidatus Diapherotrites archaeon]